MSGPREWDWSDDREDPCSLDVVWVDADIAEEGTPLLPDGTVAARVYRFVHKDCYDSLIHVEVE